MFILKPLKWDKQEQGGWIANGIRGTYSIKKEHKRLRLYCSIDLSRTALYDFDDYYDAMVFAEKHHLASIRQFIKEVPNELAEP